MNKQRRIEIDKALKMVDEARAALETARDEEQDYFDNMPESMQGGDKGSAAEAAIEALSEAVDSLENVISTVEGAIGE